MRVLVSSEHRFVRVPDGGVWAAAAGGHSFWRRYLDVFEEVRVLARVESRASVPSDWHPVESPRINVVSMPYYFGPAQFLLRARDVNAAVLRAAEPSDDAVIMRVSSPAASTLCRRFRRMGRPFGLEVVGDPHDAFSPGAIRHPLRPLFRWWFARELRHQCATASAVSYVTASALQRRYPPGVDAFATTYSSVDLPEAAFVGAPRAVGDVRPPARIVTVGSLANLHKGPDILLDAIAHCVSDGLELEVVIVGEGRHRSELESRSDRLGLTGRIRFAGELPAGEAVRTQFDLADVFVLPSRAEGLPRAMIEAMARGLPCIGSTVGGIPELLISEDMVPPSDARALADKIATVIRDAHRLAGMSSRNLSRAANYSEDVLRDRRIAFYEFVRDATREWSKAMDAGPAPS